MEKTIRLGEKLVQNAVISKEDLAKALNEQKKTGAKLGNVLIRMGLVSEETLLSFLSEQLNIPVFDLNNFIPDQKTAELLPESHAKRLHAVILEKKVEGSLVVGMVDPLDITATDDLRRILNHPIVPVLVSNTQLNKSFDLIYRHTEEINKLAYSLGEEIGEDKTAVDLAAESKQADAPVIKLLQTLFENAVQANASDIHIEPGEKILRIRLRIDGVLNEQIIHENNIASAIAMRLKLISSLNVTEKRLPQDGRFNINVNNHIVDVRLSFLPTQYGESIVMRLLDQLQVILNLDKIITTENTLKDFRNLLHKPNGLILVTGPTGSGKTTTLYAALNELNEISKNIITIEDPVEFRLPRINQVQVNSALDLTFARVLRSTLRQDPNIILVGEMRDQETASIAMSSALTGHLVLSTLHTNDAASSALRLIDMNVEGYLVAATLRGVLAQRLVRKICDNCKAKYDLTEYEHRWIRQIIGSSFDESKIVYGKGCNFCNSTGYKGRIAIFELLTITQEMQDALITKNPNIFSKLAFESLQGKLLADDATKLVINGSTTINEAMRIAGGRW
jgi:MSHA biogenesis protein MshE